jgi:hypothetical protein
MAAVAAAAEASIKQKHRKMFPSQYRTKRRFGEAFIPDGIISL